jgi:hypothetical protein
MKKFLVCSIVLFLIVSSDTLAGGLAVNFVHPDKLQKVSLFSAKSAPKEIQSDLLGNIHQDLSADFSSDCAAGCSSSCVALAQRIVSDCAGGTSAGGTTGGPNFAACVSQMHDFFHARSGTSGDQDSADAVSYCVSGASPTCPDLLNTTYFHTRTGTTGDQDRADSARACQNGATPDCMAVVYPTFHQRTGTTATQDVNDSAAACQRQVAP